jgi:hypothetical protein
MRKNRSKQPANPASQPAPTTHEPSRRVENSRHPGLVVRGLISVLLLWHLFAVFMAPLSLPPTSQLVSKLVQGGPSAPSLMQRYLDALYINHGYHFFAPEPGPGHLIHYDVFDNRRQQIVTGKFPDLKEYWPRLRYHRYFMLAEQAELPFPNREAAEAQQLTLDSYARHLLRGHDGAEAHLRRERHYILSPEDSLNGDDPNNHGLFETIFQTVQQASDLTQAESASAAGQPARGSVHVPASPRSYR